MKTISVMRRAALLIAAMVAVPIAAVAQNTPSSGMLVSTDWLARHVSDNGLVVIHAATQKSDFDAGHVPGARWLAWQAYTTQREGLSTELPDAAGLDSALEAIGVRDDSRIVIVGGPITVTARLYFTLDYFGLGDRVSLLDGGIDAWREEGRALEHQTPAVARGTVTLRPQSTKRVDARWVVSNTAPTSSRVAVLDARVPEFFAGLAQSNTPRAGRLPTARNVPFTWLTGELSRFRDLPKLERLFSQAGVKKGDTVVTYCHIGMQASVLYFAARLLGHEAALYDGSFEDWSRRSELPVGGRGATPKPPN